MKKYIAIFATLLALSACALCACSENNNIVGDSFAKVYGIKMTFEYDDTTVNATDDIYTLDIGKTYTAEISLIYGGGSSPAGIRGDCITFDCSDSVAITYASDDKDEGATVYNVTGNAEETSIVTAYMGTYSCSATINWLAA